MVERDPVYELPAGARDRREGSMLVMRLLLTMRRAPTVNDIEDYLGCSRSTAHRLLASYRRVFPDRAADQAGGAAPSIALALPSMSPAPAGLHPGELVIAGGRDTGRDYFDVDPDPSCTSPA